MHEKRNGFVYIFFVHILLNYFVLFCSLFRCQLQNQRVAWVLTFFYLLRTTNEDHRVDCCFYCFFVYMYECQLLYMYIMIMATCLWQPVYKQAKVRLCGSIVLQIALIFWFLLCTRFDTHNCDERKKWWWVVRTVVTKNNVHPRCSDEVFLILSLPVSPRKR